jgi:acyl carrier protein
MIDQIRQILAEQGRLQVADSVDVDADLFEAGMSSHASVNVMLAIEDEFDVEFPDSMLKRSVFESISSIASALEELGAEVNA